MTTKAEIKDINTVNQLQLVDLKGKKLDTVELDKDAFQGRFNEGLLYQALIMYQANKRRGTASTKTRGDVRGGGKKPWRQKGTGRARAGSIRSPLWRKGGISFGPHPRDFRYSLPKKIRRSALVSSINAKLKNGKVLAIEEIKLDTPKTKNISGLLKNLKIKETALLLVAKIEKNLGLAARNIGSLTVKRIDDATALDVLSNDRLILTKDAVELLNKRINR